MNDLILLTVDSLRADRAGRDCLGSSLEVLSDDFVSFGNAYSHGVATPFAFPGIVAGSHPVGNGNLPDSVQTLAEGIRGNSTAYANNAHLNASRGYTRGFTKYEESPSIDGQGELSLVDKLARRLQTVDFVRESTVAKKIYNDYLRDPLPIDSVPADGMVELVQNQLSAESDTSVWGHWMDPHLPYHPDTAVDPPENVPPLEKLEDVKERISEADASELTDAELELSEKLYDANVRYFDKYFGSLLSWMREQSWYEDAMIAVISDHGEYFGEHGQLFHTWDIDPYDEAVHTPMWVKYPGNEDGGQTVDYVVGHGDVLATVGEELSVAELEPPEHTAPLREEGGRHVVSVSNTAKRLTEPEGKLVLRRDGTSTEEGSVSEDGSEFLETVPYPECRNSRGEALGVEEAERRQRLENLGYR